VFVLATAILFAVELAIRSQRQSWHWTFSFGLDHVPPSLEPLARVEKLGYEKRNSSSTGAILRTRMRQRAAKEFVRNRVDLIVAFETQTARAAKAALPRSDCFGPGEDAIAEGFGKSMACPGVT
jgi:hypothetical protein